MVLCEARQQVMPNDSQAVREAAQGDPRTSQVMLFVKLDGESRWRWLIMRRTVKGKEKEGKRDKKEK